MAKRWLIGGLAVGVGALAVTPEARTWLRRRLGLEPEDRRWFEEEEATAPEYEGDEPLDTREARFSLRARLSEDAPPAEATSVDPPAAFAPEAFAAPEPQVTSESEAASTPDPFAAPEPEVTPEHEPPLAEAPPEPASYITAAPEPERTPFGAVSTPEPAVEPEPEADEPEAVEPEPEPEREPEPSVEPQPEPARSFEPESTPFSPPGRDRGNSPFESLPSIVPEADAPKSPGEDTDEVAPLPSPGTWEPPAAPPPPPPTELHPQSPPPSRPFSGEGTSFRSAIDAARERVHGAAREATPQEESTEPIDKDA
ncbi:MAG TPA: hypothetical protein VFD90_08230 [Gaiellales bacterium]|jgi:hypothetical protein|nr:hypothetical protein [Gaiellales bacterium]